MPLFQNIGANAYKEGLTNSLLLDNHLGNPHTQFKCIHVAGTNGKGSVSHTLAAMLQSAGYKTGLFTSPHLIDFRERIRVNGIPIEQDYVVNFVEKQRAFFEPLHPSFFELTTALAFCYFADKQIDVAIIEVGLGGRLDCTNIIHPELSIITNISFDHTQFLGDTLTKIATEKAGIIKADVPVVIGETTPETKEVFLTKANDVHAPITFAEEENRLLSAEPYKQGFCYTTTDFNNLYGELGGIYQTKNTNTLLSAIAAMQHMGFTLGEQHIRSGFSKVCELTGLMGRWQKLEDSPTLVCDTGHNVAGFTYLVEQLVQQPCKALHIVFGMVDDKDIDGVLAMLPKQAHYYFTQASVKRALPIAELQKRANVFGLHGDAFPNVTVALQCAKAHATAQDFIFVGGSSYIVADLLSGRNKE